MFSRRKFQDYRIYNISPELFAFFTRPNSSSTKSYPSKYLNFSQKELFHLKSKNKNYILRIFFIRHFVKERFGKINEPEKNRISFNFLY
jgi:hypothetical protein